jgi:calnexin
MQIVSFIFIFYLLNFSLIRSNTDDQTTIDTRSNVPVIKSSSSNIFFEEQFQDKTKWLHWTKSQAKKDGVDENISKYDGEWTFENSESSVYKNNYGLILKVIKNS